MFLETVDRPAIGEGQIVIHIIMITAPRFPSPQMLIGGMVEHEIEYQADAAFSQCGCQPGKFFDGAEIRIDRPVVTDRVSTVIFSMGNGKNWHQMQIGHPKLFKIGDMILQPPQIVTEQIDIKNNAHHFLGRIPQGIGFACDVVLT